MPRILLNLLAAVEGAQVVRAKAFLERFSSLAPDCELIVLKDASSLKFLDGARWQVVNVPIGRGRLKALRRMSWECTALPGLMRKLECDVYLTFSHFLPWRLPANTLSVVGVSNLAPFSRAAWAEEVGFLPRLKLVLQRRSILSSVRRASRVIALSHAGREALDAHGIDTRKITVIPNGVEREPAQRPPARELLSRYGIDGSFILCVSHFHRYKNFSRLLEAYSMLPDALQRTHRLVLVGRPYVRSYFEEVLERIEALNLRERVLVIPGLDPRELAELYSEARLFVFPSLIENCPMILLEAMAHGLPLVSARIAPMPEFAGEAASYFDPFSAKDCAKVIEETLNDQERLSAMRHRSLARSRLFSWDAFGAAVADLCAGRERATVTQ